MPTAPARAYAMKARQDQDAPEVIVGIFSLFDIEMHALIDLGSTHSYVCLEHVFDKVPAMEKLGIFIAYIEIVPLLYKQESFSLI